MTKVVKQRIILSNGHSFEVTSREAKRPLRELSPAEIKELEDRNIRSRKDGDRMLQALAYYEASGKLKEASVKYDVKYDALRDQIRNKRFLAKYGVKRTQYRFLKNGRRWPSKLERLLEKQQASPSAPPARTASGGSCTPPPPEASQPQ